MCGISGIFHYESQEPVQPYQLEQMMRLQIHRGPDDQSLYLDGAVGLGFVRLSIIDLSNGRQPMCNETDDVWIVFNGEIWNYVSLRADLLKKGHSFKTNSDTETIVHAYEEYGVDCVKYLNGMFSFAIWDKRTQSLFMARDRVGKKPFYYTNMNGSLVFSSEIKSILSVPGVERKPNPQALADYLSIRYVPGTDTLFQGIYQLQPGFWMLCKDGHIRQEQYWDVSFDPDTKPLSEKEYIEGIRHHIQEDVSQRLMSEVPLGVFLSGGLDSSILVSLMSKLNTSQIKTFSVGFDVDGYSELPYARKVSDHFNTEHHELLINEQDLIKNWPALTWHRDEPVSDASDFGVYGMSKLASEHVTVVLSGEGADEIFAGYPKYVMDAYAPMYQRIPEAIRHGVLQPLINKLPFNMRKYKLALQAMDYKAPARWIQWFGIFSPEMTSQLFSAKFQQEVNMDYTRAFSALNDAKPQKDNLASMLYLDTKFWLPDNLLLRADKLTMAASIEARMPFLDYNLIEYAAKIPSAYKTRGGMTKHLLKQAFVDMVPKDIVFRKKVGFAVPTAHWFRNELADMLERLLLSEQAMDRGYFNMNYIRQIIRDHREGKVNYQNQLSILASLEIWFRVFMDSSSLEKPEYTVEDLLANDNKLVSPFQKSEPQLSYS